MRDKIKGYKMKTYFKKKQRKLAHILEKSMDSDSKLDHTSNLIDCSFIHFPSLLKFSPKFICDFLSYLFQNQIHEYMNGQKCNLPPGQRHELHQRKQTLDVFLVCLFFNSETDTIPSFTTMWVLIEWRCHCFSSEKQKKHWMWKLLIRNTLHVHNVPKAQSAHPQFIGTRTASLKSIWPTVLMLWNHKQIPRRKRKSFLCKVASELWQQNDTFCLYNCALNSHKSSELFPYFQVQTLPALNGRFMLKTIYLIKNHCVEKSQTFFNKFSLKFLPPHKIIAAMRRHIMQWKINQNHL